MYAGKLITANRRPGMGLVGRETAALGASLVQRGAAVNPRDTPLFLPLGVFHIYVRPRSDTARFRVKLNVTSTLATVHAARSAGARFDIEKSLSSGGIVFRDDVWDRPGTDGTAIVGVVVLKDDPPSRNRSEAYKDLVFAHERVHVVQSDFSFAALTAPVEGWLLQHLPGGRFVARYFDPGLNLYLMRLLNRSIETRDRPWEKEAYMLTGERWPFGRR